METWGSSAGLSCISLVSRATSSNINAGSREERTSRSGLVYLKERLEELLSLFLYSYSFFILTPKVDGCHSKPVIHLAWEYEFFLWVFACQDSFYPFLECFSVQPHPHHALVPSARACLAVLRRRIHHPFRLLCLAEQIRRLFNLDFNYVDELAQWLPVY